MSSRILLHVSFLNKLTRLRNIELIAQTLISATKDQIGTVIEIFFNIHKFPFAAREHSQLAQFLPIIRHIGSIRSREEAVRQLSTFGSFIFPLLLPAAIDFANLNEGNQEVSFGSPELRSNKTRSTSRRSRKEDAGYSGRRDPHDE